MHFPLWVISFITTPKWNPGYEKWKTRENASEHLRCSLPGRELCLMQLAASAANYSFHRHPLKPALPITSVSFHHSTASVTLPTAAKVDRPQHQILQPGTFDHHIHAYLHNVQCNKSGILSPVISQQFSDVSNVLTTSIVKTITLFSFLLFFYSYRPTSTKFIFVETIV